MMKIPYPKINRRLRQNVDEVVFLVPLPADDTHKYGLHFSSATPDEVAVSKAKQIVSANTQTVWGEWRKA